MRRYGLFLAAMLAVLGFGYWLGRDATHAAPTVPTSGVANAAVSTTAGDAIQKAATASAGKPVVAARPLNSAASGVTVRASAPLPAPGTPLKETRAELEVRAKAGDADAASRLFRDTQRCADVRRINATIPRFARHMLDQKSDGLAAEALRNREKMLAHFDKQLNFARDNATLCEGFSDEEISQLLPQSLQAATLGDLGAADCYVATGTFGMPAGMLDHPDWLTDYKQNALSIATAAIERGDWHMVGMLSAAYSNPMGYTTLLSQATGQDTVQAYRYKKLLSLGTASGKGQDYAARELADMANEISPEAKVAADTWAQETYHRAFATNPLMQQSGGCRSEGL